MSKKVLIVGDLMIDVVVNMPGEMVRGSDMPSEIATTFGGTAANVATWLSKCDTRSRVCGVVGDDLWGAALGKHLDEFGIELHLRTSATQPTGAVVALCHPDGERSFFPDARANSELTAMKIDDELFQDVGFLYISGYTLLNENTRDWALKLMHEARLRKILVVLDPASSGPLSSIDAAELAQWLESADVLLPNEQESSVLLTKIPRTQWPVSNVVTKCGGAGARVETSSEVISLSAPRLDIVDTIGAGDAFAAGLLAGLASGAPLEHSARTAIKVASAAVVIRGAQPSVSSTLELS